MSVSVDLVWQRESALGEGPIWHEGKLWWVDISGGDLLSFDPATGDKSSWKPGGQLGTIVPRSSGGWLIAGDTGFFFFDPVTGQRDDLDSPPATMMNGRFNDGKCDPSGRFFAGTIDMDGHAAFFRLDPNLRWERLLTDVTISNGLTWWEDKFYYIDSKLRWVDVFDTNAETGAITNRRLAFSTEQLPGLPDGMTIDRDGTLWIAFYGGAQVVGFDRETGATLATIPVPALQPTACWFGGEDLGDLYITTAAQSMNDDDQARYPLTGSLFRFRPGSIGLSTVAFSG